MNYPHTFVKSNRWGKVHMLTFKNIKIKCICRVHIFIDGKITNKNKKIMNTKSKRVVTFWEGGYSQRKAYRGH